MADKQSQHVIEKTDARFNAVNACSIEVQCNVDRRLIGLAADASGTHGERYRAISADGKPDAREITKREIQKWLLISF